MKHAYEFVSLRLSDRQLHGLRTGEHEALAMHVHGTWGNFYENGFALGLTDVYSAAGWSYASVNNSGHDGGSIHEDFDASLPEIRAWLEYLAPSGGKLLLQGHSLGALKILRLLREPAFQELHRRVSAVVLFSPFDLVAFNGGVGEDLARNRAVVQRAREQKGGESLVDVEIFPHWPLSVDTYLEATRADGPWDLFPTRNGEAGGLAMVDCPLLVAIGGKDFASYPDPRAAADVVRTRVPGATVAFIDEAPHNFAGHEQQLGESVQAFLGPL